MKKLLAALFVFASFIAAAQPKILYYQKPATDFGVHKISKSLLQADMDFWQQVMEESHVNPYHAISRDALIALKKKVLAALPDSVTAAQATFAISEIIGAINEGHLGFASNPYSDSMYAYHSERFPYLLQSIENDGWIVRADLSTSASKLPAMSRVISVNGISTSDLYTRYAKLFGGLEAWKKVQVRDYIRKLMYMDEIKNPFAIKAVTGKDTISFTIKGSTRQEIDSIVKTIPTLAMQPAPFRFNVLSGNIAYIQFNSMDGSLRDSFSVFLKQTFATIKKIKAKGLIIDLRQNGGGDSGLGDSLISYFTGKKYRSAGGVKIRISKHSNGIAKLRGSTEAPKADTLINYIVDDYTKPVHRALRYNGKTAVLIGNNTFSSANMLTNAIKDFRLATLIGEPTAEPGNDFGETFPFMLPNTHIIATGATKMFVRANGDDKDFNGIQPDIYSKSSAADILAGTDRVLNDARRFIDLR